MIIRVVSKSFDFDRVTENHLHSKKYPLKLVKLVKYLNLNPTILIRLIFGHKEIISEGNFYEKSICIKI